MDPQPQPQLVTENKVLFNSDLNPQQNRLLIPITDVRSRLLPLLSLDEKRDANLLNLSSKRKKYGPENSSSSGSGSDGGACRRKKTEVGRKHGGLDVRMIPARAGNREIGMTLTRWDGSCGAVLKGGADWRVFVEDERLRVLQKVDIWVCRRTRAAADEAGRTTELCFLLRPRAGGGGAVPRPHRGLDLSLSLAAPGMQHGPRSPPASSVEPQEQARAAPAAAAAAADDRKVQLALRRLRYAPCRAGPDGLDLNLTIGLPAWRAESNPNPRSGSGPERNSD